MLYREKPNTAKYEINLQLLALIGVMFIFLFFSSHAHATDLLAGTMNDVKDTVTGTGKKWIVAIDFALSLGVFAMTKKPFVFFSTLGVLLAISGMSAFIS
tara:strand:+ start:112 stop:411 length:300 start_codon:yes stop_codon:yes gene_type:complete